MAKPLTLAHIEAQRRLRLLIATAVGNVWRDLPGYDEPDADRFIATVAPVVLTGQRHSVALTEAYLARVLGRQPLGIDPDSLIGPAVRAGATPEQVYRRPFVTIWTALATGTQWQDAVNAGLARATSTAEMDVQLSSRATYGAVQQADDGIYGFQRVADGDACDYCSGIDGAYTKDGDAMPLHNRCGCGLEPLEAPHPRAAFLPSGVAVHEHGELGPLLTSPDDHFTRL